MLKENSSLTLNMQKAIDIIITGISFISAYYIKKFLLPSTLKGLAQAPNYYIILLLIIIAWYISFKWMGMYMSYREEPCWKFFVIILKSCLMGMILVSLAMYFLHIQGVSRLLMGIFLLLNIFLLSLHKFIIFKVLKKIRTDGFNIRNVLVVGSRERARRMIETVEAHKSTGYRILGAFETDARALGKNVVNGHKVIGLICDLEDYLRNNIVDELIFAMPLKKIENCDRYIDLAETMGIKVRVIPDWELHYLMYLPNIATVRFEDFLGIYNMAFQSTPQNEGKILIKNAFDIVFAVVSIILFMPFLVCVAMAIKCCPKGPVFYTQERLGKNGRRFMMYKFRTMVDHADEIRKELSEMNEACGPSRLGLKIKNEQGMISCVGRVLRLTGLDALPQLFNVLKGEMSLVGPQPPIPKEMDKYSVSQRRRLSMKPGMTCLCHITPGRNELCFEEWIKLDLQYIDNWSLFNDFKILVMTAIATLTGAGR